MPAVFTFSEAGGHPHNEDAFGVRPHPVDAGGLLVAIADGMGGRDNGGRSAKIAVEAALALAVNSAQSGPYGINWPAVFSKADQAVLDDDTAGFTTLIGFTIHRSYVSGVACEGSNVFVLRGWGGSIALTAVQSAHLPVGSGEARLRTFFEEDLVSPWLIVAMAGGVRKDVGWHRITEAAGRLRGQALIDELQKLDRLPGSGKFQDDFTLILIQDGQ